MRVMTSTVGGNLTIRPPALRHIHVKKDIFTAKRANMQLTELN